jgi:hypothetical protein
MANIAHLAQRIEYFVEIHQNLSFGYLGDVVQAFRREVTDSVLRVHEAVEQRVHELVHVRGHIDSERNRGPCEANEATVPDVQRIRRIIEHVDELVDDLADPALVALLLAFSDLPGLEMRT